MAVAGSIITAVLDPVLKRPIPECAEEGLKIVKPEEEASVVPTTSCDDAFPRSPARRDGG